MVSYNVWPLVSGFFHSATMSSGVLHIVARVRLSFLFYGCMIFHCTDAYPSSDGRFGGVYFSAVGSSASVYIWGQVFV